MSDFAFSLSSSGVYLASVIYHEDRVAMTTEDFLPVLEVDESYPSSIHADFHWLMKVMIINFTCYLLVLFNTAMLCN